MDDLERAQHDIQQLNLPDRWFGQNELDLVIPAQQALIWHPAREKIVPSGRRSGKTELAKRDGPLQTTYDRPNPVRVGYCAPSFTRCKDIYFEDLRALIPPWWLAPDGIRQSINYMEFRMRWGAVIRLMGMSNPRVIEGVPWDKLYLDEFADYPPKCYQANIRPALSTRNRPGAMWAFGVPDEVGSNQIEYETLYERGLEWPKDPNIVSIWWSSEEILSPSEIVALTDGMDETFYRQEILGEFIRATGKAFPKFSRGVHVDNDYASYIPTLPLCHTFDFGSANSCSLICQDFGDQFLILDELYLETSSTAAHCEAFVDRCQKHGWDYGHVRVYGDAAGRTPGSNIGKSDYEIIAQQYRGLLVEFENLINSPPIKDTVNVVRWALCDVNRVAHLFVNDRCKHLINDMREAEWPAANRLQEFHALAALRYYLFKRKRGGSGGVTGVSRVAVASSDAATLSSRYSVPRRN